MENLKTQLNKYLPHIIKGMVAIMLIFLALMASNVFADQTIPEKKQNAVERNEEIEDEIRELRNQIKTLEEEYSENETEIHAYNLIIEGDALLKKKVLTQNEENEQ